MSNSNDRRYERRPADLLRWTSGWFQEPAHGQVFDPQYIAIRDTLPPVLEFRTAETATARVTIARHADGTFTVVESTHKEKP